MSETARCGIAADGERIHRYVAGTLEPDAVAGFEEHLLWCVECQAAVREGAEVAAALRRISAAGAAPAPPRRQLLRWLVPLAIAASGLWLIVGREPPLVRLGRVSRAPGFSGVAVRGNADRARQLADSGMVAYGAGRYHEAGRLLGSVTPPDRTPALSFYHGVALLMSGDAAAAIHVLREVPDGSAYAAEARYYSAKAWLLTGQGDSALVQLTTISSGAGIAAAALALADSVRRVTW